MEQLLDVYFTTNSLQFVDHGGYESRHVSTMKLIRQAWERYIRRPGGRFQTPTAVRINTGDIQSHHRTLECDLSYSVRGPADVPKCIPHYLFDAWPECGVRDYTETFQEMVTRGSSPPTDDRAFWIGARTNDLRAGVCDLKTPLLDARMMTWTRTDPKALSVNTPAYVSLPDHCAYRVLMDLGAAGFSARVPLLLASGRPLILAERAEEAWYYWDGSLQPWVHYIPCKATPEAVLEAIEWTDTHREEADAIGRRGRAYAQTYLTREAVLERVAMALLSVPTKASGLLRLGLART